MKALSVGQRLFLAVLADGRAATPTQMAASLNFGGLDTSRRGVTRTAGSLCRRGYTVRHRTITGGICYRITEAGLAQITYEQTELGPPRSAPGRASGRRGS